MLLGTACKRLSITLHAGRGNAEEMVKALRGLELMEQGSADLHEQLLAHNTELQATGGTFAASLDEMHKLQHISGAVNSSKQVKGCGRQAETDLACAKESRMPQPGRGSMLHIARASIQS